MDNIPQVCCPLQGFTLPLTISSGYDFGYFLKILTAVPLPFHESDFHHILTLWFPSIFDIKYIHRTVDKGFKGGLKDVANELGVCSIIRGVSEHK